MKPLNLTDAIWQESLSEPRSYLLDYASHNNHVLPQEVWDQLSARKASAVAEADQLTARATWCLEEIGHTQDAFVTAFVKLSQGSFKEAWDQFAQCENYAASLDRHIADLENAFGVEHIRKHTSQFQELFPLKLGVSPGILIKESRCSICDSVLTLRNRCPHELGNIYDGEECVKVVSKYELLHVALVPNPMQKTTMIFPDENHVHIFDRLRQLSLELKTPWREWSLSKEERRTHHPAFKGIGRNQHCPCGSRTKYNKCCLTKERVFPHYIISITPS